MYRIELLKKTEIVEAAAIVGKNYSNEYQDIAFLELKQMFSEGRNLPKYFVAKDSGIIIGLAGYIQSWMDFDIYEIFWVNVIPKMQRKGVGKQLVSKLISEIKNKKDARLIVLSANQEVGNPVYYERNFGFKTIQTFGKTEGYHLMSKRIK